MLDSEVLKVLESEWVQSPKDKLGRDSWGFELKPGAPESVKMDFLEFLEAQACEDELSGMNTDDPKVPWLYRQLEDLRMELEQNG